MIQSSGRSRALQAAAVIAMQELARELWDEGHLLYPLVLGESDLPTPSHIVEAGQQALADGFTFYPPATGYAELRYAIADKVLRFNQLHIDPDAQIFVTNGSGMGLFMALLASVNPGDEIIVSDPTYGPFLDAIHLIGATAVFVPMTPDWPGQLRWEADGIARAVTRNTRAIIINSPSAPTGSVLNESELHSIANIAIHRDLTIISDEVFETLLFDERQHISIAALDPEIAARTITVFSFSKSYSMTGWRLGYNIGPTGSIAAMEQLSMAFGRPAAAFTQQAGIAALTGPQDFIYDMTRDYTNRRKRIESVLGTIPGIRWITPEGSFYYFLDFSSFGDDSHVLAERVLREAHVVLTPGTFYGPGGQGWLRLSFAGPIDVTLTGLEALRDTLKRW